MEFIKLQLASLLVVLYVTIIYIKDTMGKELPCNKYFDVILYVAPWCIVFDGLTAWTVNHLGQITHTTNVALHGLFFLLIQVTIVAIFLYFCNASVGLPKSKLKMALLFLPFLVSEGVGLATLKDLEFIQGVTTNYSMGVAAYTCFGSVFFYFGMVLFITLFYRKQIEKRNYLNILSFIIASLAVIIIQVINPEALLTSFVPTILIIGIYMNLEDPSHRRLEKHNAEMTSSFATLVENRDNNTGGHIKRTKEYVRMMLGEMVTMPQYKEILTKDFVKNMINAAPLHDIGKISTPDNILQKPGKLTDEEYAIMKLHAPTGGEIIKETFKGINEPEFLETAYQVARFHHEKWNGRGYPEGISGEQIPLCARIMAVADVFDAVSARRVYRDAMPLDKCFQIIESGAGSDFDPELVKIFMNAREKILEIYHRTFE